MLLRQLLENRGLGRGGGHGVDRDFVTGELLAERLCQCDQAGFRSRIMRGVGVAFLAGDRGDVDDAAVILPDHVRDDRLAADERPVEIDAQDLAPLIELGLPYRPVDAGNAGIVDENVDLAERLERRIPRLFDRGEIGDIDLESRDRAADFFGGLIRERLVMIPDRDLCAGSNKALGDGPAKTLCAAGNDGAAAVHIDLVHGHIPSSLSVIPGWSEGPDPESRDSGFASSTRPGMTLLLMARLRITASSRHR